MSIRVTPGDARFAFGAAAEERLRGRVERALTLARRTGAPALGAVTVPVPPELDLSAAVLAARRPDDRFACLEQPDRDGFALAALGQAMTIEARGPGRFAEVAARARELGRAAFADDPAEDPSGRPPPAPCSWAASRSRTTAAGRRSGRGSPRRASCCRSSRSPGRAARPA